MRDIVNRKEIALRKFVIPALIVSAFLVGCGKVSKGEAAVDKNLADVKAAVLAELKDPDSAKFGKFELIDDNHACIEVNAKNSYGGYSGVKPFPVMKVNGKWVALKSVDFPFDLVVKTMREGKL